MANFYGATALTGGTSGCLDAINGALLSDGDMALVRTLTTAYEYTLDADSAAAASSPGVISPVTNAGDKRWIRSKSYLILSEIDGLRYAADAEASDTYVITLSPAPAALYAGMTVTFKANTANTGACTLNVNSLGAKSIKKHHDQDPATGDIESGQMVTVVYDGTNFQMQSQPGLAPAKIGANNFADTTQQRMNLLDCGIVTNAIGSIGGGAQTIDIVSGNSVSGTVDTAETTFTFSNPTASDELCVFSLVLANGGSQTVNWPASVDWTGGVGPSLTASGADILVFATIDGGTIWHGSTFSLDSK